jgi:quercetin dioxygenase-like cupin family protein
MNSRTNLYRWDDLEIEQVSPALQRRLITGERIMLAQVMLEKGALIPAHEHIHEQFTYVMAGSLRFRLGVDGTEDVSVRAGEVLHLPSNARHGAEVLEDSMVLDVFSPPREDWLQQTDDYLRR